LTELEQQQEQSLVTQDKHNCEKPSSVVGKQDEVVAAMFGSHDWKVFESKPFGTTGVLVHFICTRCNAVGMATLNDGDDDEEGGE
jgi:hypothetical protein